MTFSLIRASEEFRGVDRIVLEDVLYTDCWVDEVGEGLGVIYCLQKFTLIIIVQ